MVPVHLTVFEDRSFAFVVRTPPASDLIRQALNIEKGAAQSGRERVGQIRRSALEEIAKQKMADLNASSLDTAVNIIAGTARSMGIEVSEE